MPGVKAILTADDLPAVVAGANLGEGIIASPLSERGLTMEPLYEGEPILAVAAVDEFTAAEAIERIHVELRAAAVRGRSCREPPPWIAERSHRGQRLGPARSAGAPGVLAPAATSDSRTEVDRRRTLLPPATASCRSASTPMNGSSATSRPGSSRPTSSSTRRSCCRTPATSRSRRAPRWPTGRTASFTCTVRRRARCARSARSRAGSAPSPTEVVIISEYTGGGFGSKGSSSVFTVVPALLAKKTSAPVMMRITRDRSSTSAARGRRCTHDSRSASARTDASPRSTVSPSSTTAPTTSSAMRARPAITSRSRTSRWRCGGAAVGAHQHAAARGAARARRHAGQWLDGADHRQGGAASSASIRSPSIASMRPRAKRRSAGPARGTPEPTRPARS